MDSLPQLIDEDIGLFDQILDDLIKDSESTAALILDRGGFLICKHGDMDQLNDPTTLAALASGAYLANDHIAELIGESTFNCTYQEGMNFSLLVSNIDGYSLLAVLFDKNTNLGTVKHFARQSIERIAAQLVVAHERNPDQTLDLADLDVVDTDDFFRKKES